MEDGTGQAPTTEEPQDGDSFDAEYVKKLRAENAAARVKLKELEAADATRKLADLSEVDRLKVELQQEKEKARGLELRAIRTAAANKHDIPEELHEFITAQDEAGALSQAEKLAAKLKPTELPPSGRRNPANGGEQAARKEEAERFEALTDRVPALRNRVLKG